MMCELDIKSYHVFRPNDNNGKPEVKNENSFIPVIFQRTKVITWKFKYGIQHIILNTQ